jgi:hypothetical protein
VYRASLNHPEWSVALAMAVVQHRADASCRYRFIRSRLSVCPCQITCVPAGARRPAASSAWLPPGQTSLEAPIAVSMQFGLRFLSHWSPPLLELLEPRDKWADAEYCLEWMVEDGSDTPWACHLSPGQVDRAPDHADVGKEWRGSVWDFVKGRPHKCLDRPAFYQILPALPWLRKITDETFWVKPGMKRPVRRHGSRTLLPLPYICRNPRLWIDHRDHGKW